MESLIDDKYVEYNWQVDLEEDQLEFEPWIELVMCNYQKCN